MKAYAVTIEIDEIATDVYRITANAAKERGDALHAATEDDDKLIKGFIEDGKKLLEKALGRYSTGGLDYSMPENWKDRSEDINDYANLFLKNYTIAKWYELSGAGDRFIAIANEALECIVLILNKREKPI